MATGLSTKLIGKIGERLVTAAFRTVYPGRDFAIERERRWREHNDKVAQFPYWGSDTFFKELVLIVFYSGMKASTVSAKKEIILKYLGNYKEVASFTEEDVLRVCSAKDMIKNKAKVRACIHNAKVFVDLDKEFGSFGKYLLSFNKGFPADAGRMPELLVDLQDRFEFLGPRTSRHFLMVCGFSVVKPDRMVMRVLSRLGLIPGETDECINEAVKVSLEAAKKAKIPPSFMDAILVGIGQSEGAELCKKEKPICEKCGLKPYCKYQTHYT
jgi:DNA-3-methyladenine glycosylase I